MSDADFETLARILDYLGKQWSELPFGLRDFIGLDVPRLARAWNETPIKQHREALRIEVLERIELLHRQIGFYDDEPDKQARVRQDLRLAHAIIEKLDALDAEEMAPVVNKHKGDKPYHPSSDINEYDKPSFVGQREAGPASPESGEVPVKTTLDEASPGRTNHSTSSKRRGPTLVQRLVSWLKGEGSKYRSASNKEISAGFEKFRGVPVSEETIRKARNELGLPKRTKQKSKPTRQSANGRTGQ